VVAEHEGGNTDPAGSAGFRGHPNTPSSFLERPPLSAASFEHNFNGETLATKSNIVVLSKGNSGAFQHRGRKLVSSKQK
jgi:hypothetical protein